MIACPYCKCAIADAPDLAGQLVACPACGGNFPLPPPPPLPMIRLKAPPEPLAKLYAETVLERSVLSVAELLSFISGLPDRSVVLRYPDGSEGSCPLKLLKADLKRLPSDGPLRSPDCHYFVFRARKKSGYLCLEYACAFQRLADAVCAHEQGVTTDSASQRVIALFRDLEARVEIGLALNDYANLVGSCWSNVRDYLAQYGDHFPSYCALTRGVFDSHYAALSVWRGGAGAIPVSFMGGGFGLRGAIEGMAIASVLNLCVTAANESHNQALWSRLLAEWAQASRRLRAAESVFQMARGAMPLGLPPA